MRMILTFTWATALAASLVACGTGGGSDGRLDVVASVYPLAEAAERVGGDLVAVRSLTPPGVEPHDLELAPDDLVALAQADLVLVVGGGFQPAVEDALAQVEGEALEVVSLVPALRADGGVDPHVWLDPMRFATIVGAVGEALAELDPEHARTYRRNAAAYRSELEALDAAFRRGLASCRSRLLVTSHAAFGYLADAYGLEQVPIAGLSPESEPSPARLAELRSLVEREGVTTIFTEELVSPAVAETLAAEAGVRTAVLSPLEGRSPEQARRGEGYVAIMRTNLERLEVALGCA
ncbi:MAG: zinc ABC transporter substrate-binding protein [Actinomycetota bacterium]|nr:MAG: zinc ABC transporter substrate-binding protein [Actinomycetota bacterium]